MNLRRQFTEKPWIWSFAATIIVWVTTVLFTGGASSFGLSQAALTFAAFSVIVGIGQMFVITLGPGNIDLSVPATMTLSGTLALKLMDVQDGMILVGLLASIAIGLIIGLGNYILIKLLRIPPIIATLSMSFIVQSVAIWSNRGLRIKPPETLAEFATSGLFGIPNVALVALVLSGLAWLMLEKSIYAAGYRQSARALLPPAWPAFRSMARALSPICSAPSSLPSAVTCLRAFPAARHSIWARNTC